MYGASEISSSRVIVLISICVLILGMVVFWTPKMCAKLRYLGTASGIVTSLLGLTLLSAKSSPLSSYHSMVHEQQARKKKQLPDQPMIPTITSSTMWGCVCRDGGQSIRAKLLLTASAKRSIVGSLNYGGGACFRQWIAIVRKRISAGVQVRIVASKMFMKRRDLALISDLQKRYGKRFQWQWSEPKAEWLQRQDRVNFSSNHVKALVIDGGVAFIVGGSGIQDAYNGTGLSVRTSSSADSNECQRRDAERSKQPWLPSRYRDMDWVFGTEDGSVNTRGRKLHEAMLELMDRWYELMGNNDNDDVDSFYGTDKQRDVTEGFRNIVLYETMRQEFSCVPIDALKAYITTPLQTKIPFHDDILQSIRKSKHQIWIAHMFLHWSQEMNEALVVALARGVHVHIISNSDHAGTPATHCVYVPRSQEVCRRLLRMTLKLRMPTTLRQNLHIYEFISPGCTYHKKALVIDDQVWLGNSNLGDKSLKLAADDEVNICVRSADLAEQTVRVLQVDRKYCIPFDKSQSNRHPNERLHQVPKAAMAWLHENVLYRFLG